MSTPIDDNKQARRWCFTWNNYPVDHKEELLEAKPKYLLFGYERCPTTGTPHLQGYIEFKSGKRFKTLQKIGLRCIHWSICNGTQEQNQRYCKKGGIFFEFGEPAEQGARNDLADAAEMLANGCSMLEVAEEQPGNFFRYHRGFEKYQYLQWQARAQSWRDVKVFYIWGDTGTGKSRWCWEQSPKLFSVSEGNTGTWWTGYNGQTEVLLDDFRGTVPLHMVLKWLDGYPVQVPVHGGYCYLNARTVYITSNVPLEDLYRGCDERSRAALRRRITEIRELSHATEVTGNTSPSQKKSSHGDLLGDFGYAEQVTKH